MQLAKSDRLQLSCDVLQALEVPDELHKEIIGWTRFSFERNQRTEDLKRVVMDLPPILKSRLMQFLYADSLVSVGVVGFVASIDPSFLMQLWHDVEHVPFYKGEALVHWHEKANRCIIVTEGILEVHVDRDELPQISKSEARRAADGSALASRLEGDAVLKLQLRKGDFVGELALLGDTDWGASSSIAFPGTDVRISAAGNAMCMVRYVRVAGLCGAGAVLFDVCFCPCMSAQIPRVDGTWRAHRHVLARALRPARAHRLFLTKASNATCKLARPSSGKRLQPTRRAG